MHPRGTVIYKVSTRHASNVMLQQDAAFPVQLLADVLHVASNSQTKRHNLGEIYE
jgi:hypothetical protein